MPGVVVRACHINFSLYVCCLLEIEPPPGCGRKPVSVKGRSCTRQRRDDTGKLKGRFRIAGDNPVLAWFEGHL
jgi:hypothetical protein